jgi:hypothetical protein
MATTKIRSSSIEDGQVANVDLSATIAVTGGQIADDAVTLAKMADGTQGDTLYYGAAGAPTLLAKPGTPADEVLTFATGATAPSWVAAGGGGGFVSLQLFVSTGTWTKPTDITKIVVEVQASGGGSGSNDAGGLQGGSGGGGGYALKVLDVTNIDTATVTVGAGGIASGSGNTSSFAKLAGSGSFTTVTSAGGGPGNPGWYGTNGAGGAGAATPTTGDINLAGGDGSHGALSQMIGLGGFGQLGIATQHKAAGQTARTPVGYGQGSGAGSGTSKAGGVAATGTVRVWEYK